MREVDELVAPPEEHARRGDPAENMPGAGLTGSVRAVAGVAGVRHSCQSQVAGTNWEVSRLLGDRHGQRAAGEAEDTPALQLTVGIAPVSPGLPGPAAPSCSWGPPCGRSCQVRRC